MRASVRMLGTLSPEPQLAIEGHLATLNQLEEQVVNDLVLVGRQGANVASMQTQLDVASEQIRVLDAETLTMHDEDASTWHQRASQVEASLRNMLVQLGTMRERLQEKQRFIGLGWGMGVSVGVAAIAWYVWRHRKRRRGGR